MPAMKTMAKANTKNIFITSGVSLVLALMPMSMDNGKLLHHFKLSCIEAPTAIFKS